MIENFVLTLKQGLRVVIKIAMSLLILVGVGALIVKGCPLIWPSLSNTVHEPKIEDFCGRYIPMPGTARFLRENYPGAQTWLDFNPDGSFVFNAIAMGSHSENGTATKMESGKWELNNRNGRILLMLSNDGGPFLYSGLHLKGQKPPYIIERWNDFPMEFCTNPQQSPAVRAYAIVSITDWIIQGFLVLSIVVLPFFLKPVKGSRVVGCPFMIALVWGIWRMAYYDPTTHNDIPGMGYIVGALFCPLYASIIFAVRCAFLRGMTRRKNIQNDKALSQPPPWL